MSKAAQLAQGSKFYIAGSSGAAEALTAVIAGYPTLLQITGHAGVANGDVVTFGGAFAGVDAALLNGKTAVVTHYATGASNDWFAVDINTSEKAITIGTATATPAAWTQVKEIFGIKPGGAQSSTIDVTDLDSTSSEFAVGLDNQGTISFDFFDKIADPGQIAVLAAFAGQLLKSYKIVLTGGSTRTFEAVVTKFATVPDVSKNGVQTGTMELQISGDVTPS